MCPRPRRTDPEAPAPIAAGADQVPGGDAGAAEGGSPKHSAYEGGAGASSEPGGDDEYDHAPDRKETRSDEPEGAALAEEDTRRRRCSPTCNGSRRSTSTTRSASTGTVTSSGTPRSAASWSRSCPCSTTSTRPEAGALEDGPFASIAEKLESILGRFGVERLGEKGEEFDLTVHEALMHVEAERPRRRPARPSCR